MIFSIFSATKDRFVSWGGAPMLLSGSNMFGQKGLGHITTTINKIKSLSKPVTLDLSPLFCQAQSSPSLAGLSEPYYHCFCPSGRISIREP